MTDATTTTEMRLREPYERFPCNQLRSECYRRKLPIVKSGPQANATKAGYMRLLREDDDAQGNQAATNDTPAVVTPPPAHALVWKERESVLPIEPPMIFTAPATPPRMASPPTSPMAFVELPPQRTLKRDLPVDCQKNVVEVQEKKRGKTIRPNEHQPLSDSSFFSPQTSTSAASSVNIDQDSVSTSWSAQLNELKKNGHIDEINMPRWERLHARLEVVTAKLRALYTCQGQWPPSTGGTIDDSDVEFYEMMKRQLQRGLLECVSDA